MNDTLNTLKSNIMISQNKKIITIITILLLLTPLIAMQFTNEVNWKTNDFLVAGALLLSSGFILESVLKNVKSLKNRVILSVIIILTLFLIWLELAVGIFGTPLAGS